MTLEQKEKLNFNWITFLKVEQKAEELITDLLGYLFNEFEFFRENFESKDKLENLKKDNFVTEFRSLMDSILKSKKQLKKCFNEFRRLLDKTTDPIKSTTKFVNLLSNNSAILKQYLERVDILLASNDFKEDLQGLRKLREEIQTIFFEDLKNM